MCDPATRRSRPLDHYVEIKGLTGCLAARPEQHRVRGRSIETPP